MHKKPLTVMLTSHSHINGEGRDVVFLFVTQIIESEYGD